MQGIAAPEHMAAMTDTARMNRSLRVEYENILWIMIITVSNFHQHCNTDETCQKVLESRLVVHFLKARPRLGFPRRNRPGHYASTLRSGQNASTEADLWVSQTGAHAKPGSSRGR